jgi:hydrogenase maturation factor
VSDPLGLSCTHEPGCITCGDHAVPLKVMAVDADAGLARCVNEEGAAEDVEIALVGEVRPGDALLVHAGTALQPLEEM